MKRKIVNDFWDYYCDLNKASVIGMIIVKNEL